MPPIGLLHILQVCQVAAAAAAAAAAAHAAHNSAHSPEECHTISQVFNKASMKWDVKSADA